MYYLGIDAGGSAVKLIAADSEGNITAKRKYALDLSEERLRKEIAEMLSEYGISGSPEHIYHTGASSDMVRNAIGAQPNTYFEEFPCFAAGAQKLSGISKAIAVSMGTGTAFVAADGDKYTHIGGSGVGGGTLSGLARLTLGVTDDNEVNRLIRSGNTSKVDLTIGDICKDNLGGLSADVTAANFGSRRMSEAPEDIAAGLSNMIFQTAGIMAAFACKGTDTTKAVFVGAMAEIPEGKAVLEGVGALHGLDFSIPENAAYAGALGAVLNGLRKEKSR